MANSNYQLPQSIEVRTLAPQSSAEVVLTPEREVLCIHRGRHLITEMFDSQTYNIDPGYFMCPYAVAKHFQNRAVLPGSRNPERRTQGSYIGIIGVVEYAAGGMRILKHVDPPEKIQPFTDEEVEKLSLAVEAIDRSALAFPGRQKVELFGVNEVRVAMPGAGAVVGGRRPEIQADEGALEPVAPENNAAIQQIRQDSAGQKAEKAGRKGRAGQPAPAADDAGGEE